MAIPLEKILTRSTEGYYKKHKKNPDDYEEKGVHFHDTYPEEGIKRFAESISNKIEAVVDYKFSIVFGRFGDSYDASGVALIPKESGITSVQEEPPKYIPLKGLGDVKNFSTTFSTRGSNYTSYRLCDDFNYAVARFQHDGYEIISLEDNAKLRIQQEKNHFVSTSGNRTREAFLYFPKEKKRKIVKNSPLLELVAATEATQAHRKHKEFYLTEEQVERALIDSIDLPEESIEIPTNRFDSEEIPVFLFGGEDEARLYGMFLREGKPKIKKMRIAINLIYREKHERPFVRQMRFGDIYDRSELDGPWRLDNGWYGLRGIKKIS